MRGVPCGTALERSLSCGGPPAAPCPSSDLAVGSRSDGAGGMPGAGAATTDGVGGGVVGFGVLSSSLRIAAFCCISWFFASCSWLLASSIWCVAIDAACALSAAKEGETSRGKWLAEAGPLPRTSWHERGQGDCSSDPPPPSPRLRVLGELALECFARRQLGRGRVQLLLHHAHLGKARGSRALMRAQFEAITPSRGSGHESHVACRAVASSRMCSHVTRSGVQSGDIVLRVTATRDAPESRHATRHGAPPPACRRRGCARPRSGCARAASTSAATPPRARSTSS